MHFSNIAILLTAIVSVVSLGVSLYNFWYGSRCDLKLKLSVNSFTYSCEEFTNNLGYNFQRGAIISLKISNPTTIPITIGDAYIKESPKLRHLNDLEISTEKIIPSFCRLPLKIDAVDIKTVSFNIIAFNRAHTTFTLVLETPRKDFEIEVNLLDYHEQVKILRESSLELLE